jgi:hypothetical protein
MPKIRVEKEMNLGELLCWAIENKKQASYRDFYSKNIQVKFNGSGHPKIIFNKQFLPIYEKFIVRTEEPITEDTQVPNLRHLTDCGFTYMTNTRSIKECKTDSSIAFYIMNNDLTMTLIWTKEKGLVK